MEEVPVRQRPRQRVRMGRSRGLGRSLKGVVLRAIISWGRGGAAGGVAIVLRGGWRCGGFYVVI